MQFIETMANIIGLYEKAYKSLPQFRLRSKIHWLCSIKRIVETALLASLARNGRALDIGCGIGHIAVLLSLSRFDVVAIDIKKYKTWFHLTKYYSPQYLQSDATYLPFADKSFDLILSYAVLEHVKDEKGFLYEICRVLSDEGLFVMGGTPNRHSLTEARSRVHSKKYSLKDLCKKLLAGGLDPIHIRNEYLIPQFLRNEPLLSLLNSLAFPLSKLDRAITGNSLLRHLPFFHSHIILCRKRSF